jgi:hypothetical protein
MNSQNLIDHVSIHRAVPIFICNGHFEAPIDFLRLTLLRNFSLKFRLCAHPFVQINSNLPQAHLCLDRNLLHFHLALGTVGLYALSRLTNSHEINPMNHLGEILQVENSIIKLYLWHFQIKNFTRREKFVFKSQLKFLLNGEPCILLNKALIRLNL